MRPIRLRRQLLTQVALAVAALVMLVPVWILVILATDATIEGYPRGFRLGPIEPTLDRFAEAWERPLYQVDFLGLLGNSLFVSGGAALIAVGLGATMAFAFARMRFPGATAGGAVLLLGAFLPPIAIAVPAFVLFVVLENLVPPLREVAFRGSTAALAILYAAFSMPLCAWLMRSAFRAISRDVDEAASLEGATRRTIFWRIALPIAAPSILVAALVAFLLGYTEFALAWLFARTESNMTLAMALAGAQTAFYTPNWGPMAAHAILMTIPVVVIVLVLQRALLGAALPGSSDD
jgi:arabinogalactan oligomer / maltooligosaccharide transport system permease protein